MSSRTPDPKSFQRFFRPLESLDDTLIDFGIHHGFEFQRNIRGSPCRVLYKNANERLKAWVVLYAEQDWESPLVAEPLTHGLLAIFICSLQDDSKFVRRLDIAHNLSLDMVQENTEPLLTQALLQVDSYVIPDVMSEEVDVVAQGWVKITPNIPWSFLQNTDAAFFSLGFL